jgi:hypothetical protein
VRPCKLGTDNAKSHDREAVMAAPVDPGVSRGESHGVSVQTNIRNERVTGIWDSGFCTECGEGIDRKMFFYSGEPPENWPRDLT